MSTHRLEVYMDSYNSKPVINETGEPVSIRIGDKINKQDWARLLPGIQTRIELTVKVEDVHHLFWDAEDCMHSLSIKVVPVG